MLQLQLVRYSFTTVAGNQTFEDIQLNLLTGDTHIPNVSIVISHPTSVSE